MPSMLLAAQRPSRSKYRSPTGWMQHPFSALAVVQPVTSSPRACAARPLHQQSDALPPHHHNCCTNSPTQAPTPQGSPTSCYPAHQSCSSSGCSAALRGITTCCRGLPSGTSSTHPGTPGRGRYRSCSIRHVRHCVVHPKADAVLGPATQHLLASGLKKGGISYRVATPLLGSAIGSMQMPAFRLVAALCCTAEGYCVQTKGIAARNWDGRRAVCTLCVTTLSPTWQIGPVSVPWSPLPSAPPARRPAGSRPAAAASGRTAARRAWSRTSWPCGPGPAPWRGSPGPPQASGAGVDGLGAYGGNR